MDKEPRKTVRSWTKEDTDLIISLLTPDANFDAVCDVFNTRARFVRTKGSLADMVTSMIRAGLIDPTSTLGFEAREYHARRSRERSLAKAAAKTAAKVVEIAPPPAAPISGPPSRAEVLAAVRAGSLTLADGIALLRS